MARNNRDDDDDQDDADDEGEGEDEGEDDRLRKKKQKRRGPSKDDKQMAMFCHLGGILGGFILPLVIWLMKKDESSFIDEHGKQALNFAITIMIAHLTLGLCTCGLFSLVIIPLAIVFHIQGAMAANRGEDFQYPMSFTFIS
jgi:uncharacterized Tic20 family protein